MPCIQEQQVQKYISFNRKKRKKKNTIFCFANMGAEGITKLKCKLDNLSTSTVI